MVLHSTIPSARQCAKMSQICKYCIWLKLLDSTACLMAMVSGTHSSTNFAPATAAGRSVVTVIRAMANYW